MSFSSTASELFRGEYFQHSLQARQFKSLFGVTPRSCQKLWEGIGTNIGAGLHKKHILWGLLLLKSYNTETVCCAIAGVTEKTFRRWAWIVIYAISDLPVINFGNRFSNSPATNCFISVDGTDCRILEPSPWSSMWYSHKFHGAGLRYEVAIGIYSAEIVWVNGPYACGLYPDIYIFQQSLKNELIEEEIVLADCGYADENCVTILPALGSVISSKLRARHETLNGRLKVFNVLSSVFRHPINKHCACFHAVANICQVNIRSGERLFEIDM